MITRGLPIASSFVRSRVRGVFVCVFGRSLGLDKCCYVCRLARAIRETVMI